MRFLHGCIIAVPNIDVEDLDDPHIPIRVSCLIGLVQQNHNVGTGAWVE